MALRRLLWLTSLLVLFATPLSSHAQGMMDPVSFSIEKMPDQVTVGESFEVRVRADIEGNWHLYSIDIGPDQGPFPTKFTAAAEGLSIDGTVTESEPTRAYDPNFETELGWHSDRATFTIPLIYRGDGSSGELLVDLAVEYQVCDDKVCLPPKTKHLKQKVQLIGGSASDSPTAADSSGETSAAGSSGAEIKDNPSTGSGNPSSKAETGEKSVGTADTQSGTIRGVSNNYASRGMLSFLWIALTAGFAALLTPCVFPMVPLTVSFFTKQSHGSGKKALSQALIFGLAIVATFTILGVLLAALIGASGANQFAANPWVNLFIGVVLIVFAVSLLGMFELRLPHQFTNWLNRKSNESSGFAGVLFMGLTISAVSFSCTAPFVGGVLAATTGGEWFYPIVGMVAFSAAFSTPFILFAMFPNWLESMPDSGSWMNVVKVLLGFIELAAAFKFLSNADLVWEWGLITRPLTIAAWIVIFALAGLYLLGYLGIGKDTRKASVSPVRVLIAIPLLAFSIYLVPGLLGSSLGMWDAWLPPKQANDVGVVQSLSMRGSESGSSHEEGWSSDYEASLVEARQTSKPVFIDFTGYTCTNCRAMEANVFPKQEVQEQFEKMVKVRLYTDAADVGPKNQQLQFKMTGTVALPTYVILNPRSGKVLEQHSGYTKTETFVNFLKRGFADYQALASRR